MAGMWNKSDRRILSSPKFRKIETITSRTLARTWSNHVDWIYAPDSSSVSESLPDCQVASRILSVKSRTKCAGQCVRNSPQDTGLSLPGCLCNVSTFKSMHIPPCAYKHEKKTTFLQKKKNMMKMILQINLKYTCCLFVHLLKEVSVLKN